MGDGKENWFVETGDPGGSSWWNSSSQQGAIAVALKIHDALVHADASAYVYWAFNDSDSSGNPSEYGLISTNTVNNPLSSKKYAAFKQFSGLVRPGAIRIDANFASNVSSVGGASNYDTVNGLDVSAYINPTDQTATVVFVNMMSGDQTINIDLGTLGVGSFATWRTSGTENYAYVGNLLASAGHVTLTVPGLSVVTLIGLNASVVPEPQAAVLGVCVAAVGLMRRR